MVRPVVSTTTEEAYQGLAPWIDPDESLDWQLLKFIQANTIDLTKINELVRDTETYLGWSNALDADNALVEYLPWLAQFVGVTVDFNLTEEDQRFQVKEVAGFKRGSIAAMVASIQLYLTGAKTVSITERDTSPYHFRIATFASETPDSAAVLAAIEANKPAGLQFTHEVIIGLTYGDLKASGKTYAELSMEFPTYGAMKAATSV